MSEKIPETVASPVSEPVGRAYIPAPKSPGTAARGYSASTIFLWLIVIVLAAAVAAQWWDSQKEARTLREEVASRLQKADQRVAAADLKVNNFSETLGHIGNTMNNLNSRQQEAKASQEALQMMYKDFSRNSDDWIISEVERVLMLASQQLQLTSNVKGALLALDSADKTLAGSVNPGFVTIRRSIESDRQKLKALPTIDTMGFAIKLDTAIANVDSLPLLADLAIIEAPVTASASSVPATAPAIPEATTPITDATPFRERFHLWLQRSQQWMLDGWHVIWPEVSTLVRVRPVKNPDAMSLSPSQAFFVRENLKLRLLNARLGLLGHDDVIYKTDLAASRTELKRYFDFRSPSVQVFDATLAQLQNEALSINIPTLQSLVDIQTYKGKP